MSAELNPYQPPAFDERPEPPLGVDGRAPLATRVDRFGAAMIDGIIQLIIMLPTQIALGVFDGFPRIQPQPPLAHLAWSGAGFALYLALNGYLLAKAGQTIGKRVVGIRIVNFADGSQTPFAKIAVWRVLPIHVVSLVPKAGLIVPLVDALFIFRKDHRCVHDHLAGTVVVRAKK